MKEQFITKKFTPESEALLQRIIGILNKYAAEGYDLSLRQLYYQLVAADLLPEKWADPKTGSTNSERSYKNIGSLVSDARLAGRIDWEMIQDRGREMIKNNHWNNPGEILTASAEQFQIDKWHDQPAYVEVMVEKQALEGVLIPVCNSLDVSFTANKGYSSSSALYEASKRFLRRARQDKEIYVIYLGDHDPSGIDMSRDVLDRLNHFLNVSLDMQANEGDLLRVKRVALNIEQVRKLKPPENPAKMTDSRAGDYVSKFGRSSWELDAIEPRALAKLVSDAILSVREPTLWAKALAREEAMKSELIKFAKTSKWS